MTSLQEFHREQQRIASAIARLRAEQERLEAEKENLRHIASQLLARAARSVGIQAEVTPPSGRQRREPNASENSVTTTSTTTSDLT